MENKTPPEPGSEAQAELQPEPPITPAARHYPKPRGFMVMKMTPNQGVMVGDDIEVRLCSSRNNRADIAIRAPEGKKIKRTED